MKSFSIIFFSFLLFFFYFFANCLLLYPAHKTAAHNTLCAGQVFVKRFMQVALFLILCAGQATNCFSQPGSIDLTFNPSDLGFGYGDAANNTVYTTSIQSDGKIIIGGSFTSYNGTVRNYIARLNADGTLDGSFTVGSGANNTVRTTSIQSDGKIIIGGSFTSYNGTAINRIARLNADGTLDGSFTVGSGADNTVRTISIQSDGKIIIGGDFTSYNGTAINRIVRLNADGTLDGSFTVGTGANGTVYTTSIQSDGKIIIGGAFTSYNGTAINRIARLNTDGTLDSSFTVGSGANNTVYTTSIQSDGKIIIGGLFTFYNGTARNYIARLNADGTLDGSFSVGTGANGFVFTTSIQSDGQLIIGGQFTSYNGTTINRIARLNADGTLDGSFTVGTGANSTVRTTSIQSDGKIIIGGSFTSYNGTARNYIARLNADGTLDGSFIVGTGANGTVYTTSIQSDGQLIIGGAFTSYNGTARNRIARLNADGTLDGSFSVGTGANSAVYTTSIQSDGKIIIGGSFTSYNGIARNYIARLNADGTLDGSFTVGAGANGTVYTTSIQSDGKIIIGGDFTSYNGTAINRIARLNTDGTLDGSFTVGTGANTIVQTTSIQSDGKIIIGGSFTSYNGTAINRIARLNTDGTLDGSFTVGSGANNTVQTTSIQSDGQLIIGGVFTSYNGTAINRIARLNADGTLDGSFTVGTGAGGTVYTTSIQSDGQLIIGGSFTSYNGTAINRIARLNADGTLDGSFTVGTGANNIVYTTSIQSDGKFIIGGDFTSYNGTGRNRIARLNNNNPTITTTTISPTTLCRGGNITVNYTLYGTYNAGNIFTAQLSDATGSFATPINIGSVTSTANTPITATIPVEQPVGTLYRIRVISTDPAVTGSDNSSNLTVPEDCTFYWVGGEGSWDNPAFWSLTSGGAGGAGIPNIHTNVVIDDNSGTSSTVVIHIPGPATWYTKQFIMTGVNGSKTPIVGAGSLLPRP